MNSELLINGLMGGMVLGSLFLAVVSFIPNFPNMLAPSWSSQFFSTVIVVIASKLITLYAVLVWLLVDAQGTRNQYFIWSYFLCMLFGIFVYFNFGTAGRNRAQTVRILASTGLAITISLGILLFYSFSAWISHSYWVLQKDKWIFLLIAVISAVDFFFFFLLWLRYWLQRGRITKEALDYQRNSG